MKVVSIGVAMARRALARSVSLQAARPNDADDLQVEATIAADALTQTFQRLQRPAPTQQMLVLNLDIPERHAVLAVPASCDSESLLALFQVLERRPAPTL